MMEPVLIIPDGHCGKGSLATILHIGSGRLQTIAKLPGFPSPAGYYIDSGASRRVYPYFNIRAVKRFVAKHHDIKARPFNHATRKESIANAPPWAIPAYSKQDTAICMKYRRFYTLMRVAA